MTQTKFQARGLARRAAMIAAASELFQDKGFEHTTVTDIVDRSGGSRRTLYEHFGNKDGLLRAIIQDMTDRVWAAVHIDLSGDRLREADLFEVGLRLFKSIANPEGIAVYRIVVAEGHRSPEIADMFLRTGPDQVSRKLVAWFERAQENGDFLGRPPEKMAQAFMGIVMGYFHIGHAIGKSPVWMEEDIVEHVRLAVGIFVNGVKTSRRGEETSTTGAIGQ